MSIKLVWLTGRVWDGAGGDQPKAMRGVDPGIYVSHVDDDVNNEVSKAQFHSNYEALD